MPDRRLEKLRYRAWRRGFREADLVLGGFADAHLSTLAPVELDAFEALLDQADQDLWSWIVDKTPAPEPFEGPLLGRIRAFKLQVARLGE